MRGEHFTNFTNVSHSHKPLAQFVVFWNSPGQTTTKGCEKPMGLPLETNEWSRFVAGVPPHLCYRRVVFPTYTPGYIVIFLSGTLLWSTFVLRLLTKNAHTSRSGRIVCKIPPPSRLLIVSDHSLLSFQHRKEKPAWQWCSFMTTWNLARLKQENSSSDPYKMSATWPTVRNLSGD